MQNGYVFKFLKRPDPKDIDEPMYLHSRNTYLHELCSKGAPLHLIEEAVRDLGANVDCINERGLTPLAIAVQENDKEMVACLLRLRAQICVEIEKGKFCNVVALSIYLDRPDILDHLLKNNGGYFINTPHSKNEKMGDLPPLAIAAEKKLHHLIDTLVRAGAFLGRESGQNGYTSLMRAAESGDIRTITELLIAGARPNQKHSKTGLAALHMAINATKSDDVISTLLKWGADPNQESDDGDTPLMMAAMKADKSAMEVLISYGAYVNHRRHKDGQTPLHGAAGRYLYGAYHIETLLGAGADPLITDVFNRTAAKIAFENSHRANLEKLEEAEKSAAQIRADAAYKKHKK